MKRYVLVFMLYLTGYVSSGFLMEGLVVIFRQSGVGLEKVGLLYFTIIFWAFRGLWAPFVDKIVSKTGLYKSFIIKIQALMILTLIVVSFLDVNKHLVILILLAAIMGFLSATNDIGSGALIHKIFKTNELSLANSFKASGNLIGHILGSGVTLIIYDKFGLQISSMFLISLVLIAMLYMALFKEEKSTINLDKKLDFKSMFIFIKDEKIWISVMILGAFGICMSYGLLTPILVDSGWGLSDIGSVVHIYGTLFAIITSFLVSFIIKKLKLINALLLMMILMSIVILTMLLPIQTSKFIVILIVSLMIGFYVSNGVVLNTIMMSKANRVNPASQIAIQSSISMLFQFISFYLGMLIASFLGYKFVIVLSSGLCLVTFVYINLVKDKLGLI
ncbi:MFS transporter [Campylobacter sp. FMV-PI01]|uniref:MFS transporter n=1 Tax=Campylobacter portucalensis TaxID=2608384 RepID=A0A6L5WLX8_9BACT|nr:MFS transporter [Campylobacter portucalensis]MSN96813.1 MFS transporter [Campylobacter portucalensis]